MGKIHVVNAFGMGSIWLHCYQSSTVPALWYIVMEAGPLHLVCVAESGSNDVRSFTNSADCVATMHQIAEAIQEDQSCLCSKKRFRDAEMPPTPLFGVRLIIGEFEFVWVNDPSRPGSTNWTHSAKDCQTVMASISFDLGDFPMPAPDARTQP